MNQINLNYLNHKFKQYLKYTIKDYICEKCNILVFYSNDENRYYDLDFTYDPCGDFDQEYKLNCEEQIIKNIIE